MEDLKEVMDEIFEIEKAAFDRIGIIDIEIRTVENILKEVKTERGRGIYSELLENLKRNKDKEFKRIYIMARVRKLLREGE